ncbi:primosomal protein N' [Lacimicrobium alkaliphilum]|uniref:Replication restart protein PriA n=1 Tax=Lacimicrobium alkaliphilum TaxID=1526571 RepID=A0ABQ1R8X9_9ALTE|nr:primosomal protein N' [Lacimicrobium alkaliphilum]GGD62553.1 primosomal protein N' [Lacimicrobium alkaliphilum]
MIVEVALPVPLRGGFDYLLPEGQPTPTPGCRVRVPFGSRQLSGVVVTIKQDSEQPTAKLRQLSAVLDHQPILSERLLEWLNWASRYYQHPLGDVISTALPARLRKGDAATIQQTCWQLTETGLAQDSQSLKRAPQQQALVERLQSGRCDARTLKQAFSATVIRALEEKGLIETVEDEYVADTDWPQRIHICGQLTPNLEQSLAITAVNNHAQGFQCFLLEGVTGSGKTEVYLQTIAPLLKQGRQILILVPEIGLTPQTVARFEQRFGIEVAVLHSGLTDKERLRVWQQAGLGEVGIIIGTRSAIFTPLANPGMIIVDEEHDGSYKQQDGWRYHARDLAVVRARMEKVPLILGSATPSLETLNNALGSRYQHLSLGKRAGGANAVKHQVLDIKGQALDYGLAKGMQQRIRLHLQQGHQVMLFINRRGFAPALICHQCGHVEECHRCERSFTLHRQLKKLQCHHCGDAKVVPHRCAACGHPDLQPVGMGTEQLEQGIQRIFPDYSAMRIDSDSARGKQKLHGLLEEINQGKSQLLIGTQILAKGHHFPRVSLVVILDVDSALFSADYRAAEHLAQLITQVAGRAGRAQIQGELWLQTHNPGHPLLQDLLNNGYQHFARLALKERQFAALPPYSYQALFRAEAVDGNLAYGFLEQVKACLQPTDITLIGPLPALMEKRQGRYRMQLLLQSDKRTGIQQWLSNMMSNIEKLPLANKVRWSLDMDPMDFT